MAKLVAGPGVYICDASVTLCAQIMHEQATQGQSPLLCTKSSRFEGDVGQYWGGARHDPPICLGTILRRRLKLPAISPERFGCHGRIEQSPLKRSILTLKQNVRVLLTCDLCQDTALAVETVRFSNNGIEYETEMCQRHLDSYRAWMTPNVAAARLVARRASRRF